MFNREKYIDRCLLDLNSILDKLEKLREEGPEINKIINKCFEHYEKDNLVLYRVFFHLCGGSKEIDFFSKLYYFLNSLIFQDQAYYKIVKEGKDVFISWSDSEDPEATKNLKEILKLFDREEKIITERKKLEKEKLKLFKKLKIN